MLTCCKMKEGKTGNGHKKKTINKLSITILAFSRRMWEKITGKVCSANVPQECPHAWVFSDLNFHWTYINLYYVLFVWFLAGLCLNLLKLLVFIWFTSKLLFSEYHCEKCWYILSVNNFLHTKSNVTYILTLSMHRMHYMLAYRDRIKKNHMSF